MSADLEVRVRAILDALPDTADGIAELFEQQGITGRPLSPCGCPVARYLKRNLGDEGSAFVSVSPVEVHASDCKDQFYAVGIAASVASFVEAFDLHHYPHLEEVTA